MVLARCAVTPPPPAEAEAGCARAPSPPPRLTFSGFFKKHEKPRMWRAIETTSDSSSSTQTRPACGWQPPRVGCARAPVVGGDHGTPGQGARAHPASASSYGGGVTAHLAKVHVHTPPRPRVVGGGVSTHLATVMAHLGAHGTTMTHFGLGTPRPWHIGAHDTPMAHLGPGTARPWRTSELAHLDHGTPRTWHTSDLAHLGAHGTTMAHLGLGTPRTWHTSDLAHLGLGTPRTWHTSDLAHVDLGTPPEGGTPRSRHTS